MKSACCLLLLLTLVPAYQAIKCLCDKDSCLSGTGPDENCPDRLGAEHYAGHEEEVKVLLAIMLSPLFLLRENLRRVSEGKSMTEDERLKLMSDMNVKAVNFLENLTTKQLATFTESILEITLLGKANKGNIKWILDEYPKKLDDMFALTYVPKPLSHQYCVHTTNEDGSMERGCGAAFVAGLGGTVEVGCYENPLFALTKTGSKEYCRCDFDLCNSRGVMGDQPSASGNTTEASSALQMSSTRISTCLLLVVMVKTFLY